MQSLNYEDQMLWSRWKEWKDPQAGDDLIRRYMPLVTYHVGRIAVGLPKSVHKEIWSALACWVCMMPLKNLIREGI